MNESMDRVIADWLDEGPESGHRDGLERALAATRRVGQRPGWSLPERWIPLPLTMARTWSQRPILAIATVALLMMALLATALLIRSQRQSPSPFRNGAVVWAADGDLFTADRLDGTPRTLVSGPEVDSDPVFSPQGDRIAFERQGPEGGRAMTVSLDGSDIEELASFPIGVDLLGWSPDGTALLVTPVGPDGPLRQTEVINVDGSGSRLLALDSGPILYAGPWRPVGRHLALDTLHEVSIPDADGTSTGRLPTYARNLVWSPDGQHLSFLADPDAIYIADIDPNGAMTDLRRLPTATQQQTHLMWSPDGKHLSFVSTDARGSSALNIADIDENGEVTDLRQVAAFVVDPRWSPDSSHLAFVQGIALAPLLQVGIVNANGSGYRLAGPEMDRTRTIDLTWAPDGRSLVIFEHPVGVLDPPVGPNAKAWSVDVATGEQTEVQAPVVSWQRLAP